MNILSRGIFRNQKLQPLFLVVAISVFFIILPLNIRITLSRLASYTILFPFVEIDEFLTKIDTTFEQNRQLNNKLDSLTIITSFLMENKYENERLRMMLGFNLNIPFKTVPAEVIGSSQISNYKSLLINAGEEKGIKKNMAVISPSGVVGKVIESGWRSAVVQLITDPYSRVGAMVQSSRSKGLIRYLSGKNLALENIPVEEKVLVGDSVVTSGLGGIFPGGIFIGTVEESEDKEGELFRRVAVKPGVNINTIEEVFVLVSAVE